MLFSAVKDHPSKLSRKALKRRMIRFARSGRRRLCRKRIDLGEDIQGEIDSPLPISSRFSRRGSLQAAFREVTFTRRMSSYQKGVRPSFRFAGRAANQNYLGPSAVSSSLIP